MIARSVLTFCYALLALSVLAVATPWNVPPPVTVTVTATAPAATVTEGTCSSGPVQCCNSITNSNDASVTSLLGLLGIVLEGVTSLIGLGCSPISVVGVGAGSACSSNVVCCENNAVGGLISIGCIPIIL
ncbi:hydrophobin family protein [Phanerochaete sordida]|uniref:Hydrophobin n=1 Tax=Phanerochaete sordida TaxID=48140 RepID=A0A9P3LEE4_9APHY|nr:hydrophobin family protein [Phanerochaete sordida]